MATLSSKAKKLLSPGKAEPPLAWGMICTAGKIIRRQCSVQAQDYGHFRCPWLRMPTWNMDSLTRRVVNISLTHSTKGGYGMGEIRITTIFICQTEDPVPF